VVSGVDLAALHHPLTVMQLYVPVMCVAQPHAADRSAAAVSVQRLCPSLSEAAGRCLAVAETVRMYIYALQICLSVVHISSALILYFRIGVANACVLASATYCNVFMLRS
jgi:hypothetical protein